MTSAGTEWEGKELLLVVGDLHIPHRADDIPEQFKQLLHSRVSQVLCTGNLVTRSTEEYVRSLAYNAHIVKGDMDAGLDLPEQRVIRVGEVSIGLVHGHQLVPWGDLEVAANHARSMGVDVLISGHGHVASVAAVEAGGTGTGSAKASPVSPASAAEASSPRSVASSATRTLLLNPGSLTGAYSPFSSAVLPSFLLLAVSGPRVTVYQYELNGAEVGVTKTEWSKAK